MLAYDIGAYNGETSVLIAQAVGPANVVIIEPSEVNWPSIEERWTRECQELPRATFPGFLDAADKYGSRDHVYLRAFPPEGLLPTLDEDKLEFRWLNYRHEDPNVEARPRLTLDTLASIVGPPAGFTMDVEGSELCVLRGAEKTLRQNRPLVWVSIHPLFMYERFQHDVTDLFTFMMSCRYRGELLVRDHEDHFFFQPEERCA